MIVFTLGWALLFQAPASAPSTTPNQTPPAPVSQHDGKASQSSDLWTDIAVVENQIRRVVLDQTNRFMVTNGDPVRGYYLDRVGVVFLTPVRHVPRLTLEPERREKSIFPVENQKPDLEKRVVERKIKAWKDQLQKAALQREANFEQVVAALQRAIPAILENLSHLPEGERLMLIIEEREPAWHYPGLRLRDKETRKVVTLTVDQTLIAKLKKVQTTPTADWQSGVKRTTAARNLVSERRPQPNPK